MSDHDATVRHQAHDPQTQGRRHTLPSGERRPQRHTPGTPGPGDGASLYSATLDAAGRRRLELAVRLSGLDEEIALLRVRIAENVDDPKRLEGLLQILIKAVAVQHRLSQQHQDDLYQSVLNVIQGIGEAAGLSQAPSEN